MTYKSAQYTRVLRYTRLEMPAKYKNSDLLGPFANHEENGKVVNAAHIISYVFIACRHRHNTP
jgi:hypothetical protein